MSYLANLEAHSRKRLEYKREDAETIPSNRGISRTLSRSHSFWVSPNSSQPTSSGESFFVFSVLLSPSSWEAGRHPARRRSAFHRACSIFATSSSVRASQRLICSPLPSSEQPTAPSLTPT